MQRKIDIKQILDIRLDLGEHPPGKHLRTIWVKRKSDGHQMRINETDYGEKDKPFLELDYLLTPDYDPNEGMDYEPKVVNAHNSLYSESDLATMSITQLRLLPEFTRIIKEVRMKLRFKADYVRAILDVRSTTPSVREVDQSEQVEQVEREAL
jgi:hypothetical protein